METINKQAGTRPKASGRDAAQSNKRTDRKDRRDDKPRSNDKKGEVVPGFGGGTPSTTPGGASGKM
jgi:hypothetical protein